MTPAQIRSAVYCDAIRNPLATARPKRGVDIADAMVCDIYGLPRASAEPPYGPMCRNPDACAGKGYCPLDPTCGD